MLDDEAPVVISSQFLNRQDGEDEYHASAAAMGEGVDPRKAEKFEQRVLQPKMQWCNENRMMLGYQTTTSKMTLACAADHTIETDNFYTARSEAGEDMAKIVYRVQAKPGQTIKLSKAVVYHTSRGVPVKELFDRCRRTLDRVAEEGIDQQFADQRAWMDAYWARCDVEIPGQPRCSRPCAGTSSSSPRRPAAPRAWAFRPRESAARATADTTSGTPRST